MLPPLNKVEIYQQKCRYQLKYNKEMHRHQWYTLQEHMQQPFRGHQPFKGHHLFHLTSGQLNLLSYLHQTLVQLGNLQKMLKRKRRMHKVNHP
jgi:hypothetical protein